MIVFLEIPKEEEQEEINPHEALRDELYAIREKSRKTIKQQVDVVYTAFIDYITKELKEAAENGINEKSFSVMDILSKLNMQEDFYPIDNRHSEILKTVMHCVILWCSRNKLTFVQKTTRSMASWMDTFTIRWD